MPAQTLEIVVRLRDLASRGLMGVSRSVGTLRNGVGLATSALFSFKGALAALGLGAVARSTLNVAASFEAMELKLDALTKGRGVQTLDEINAWAKEMPVNTQQAVDSFTMMLAMGLDPTLDKMTTLVDVSVQFGDYAMPRIARALGQMATLGRLSAEELNQLSEVGINARKYITQAFGQTVEEVQKSGVEITKIIDVIWQGLQGEFGGSAVKAQTTWRGIMTQIVSEFTEAQRQIMGAGLFDFIKFSFLEILQAFKSIKQEDLDNYFQQISNTIINSLKFVGQSIGVVADAWRGWKMIWNGLMSLYANFSAWLNGMLLADARSIDNLLTTLENAIRRVGQMFQAIEDASRGMVEFGFTDALAQFDSLSGKMDGIVTSLEEGEQFWRDIAQEAAKAVRETAEEETYLQRINSFFARVEERARKYREEREKAANAAAREAATPAAATRPSVGRMAYLEDFVKRAQILNKQEEEQLKISFENREISAEEYYQRRIELARDSVAKEIELLQAAEAAEKKPEKRLDINRKIFQAEQTLQQQILGLKQEESEAIIAEEQRRTEEQNRLNSLRIRELRATAGTGAMEAQFAEETQLMEQRHAEELQRLRNLNASKAEIEETYRVQQLEKEQLFADQRRRIHETVAAAISDTLGNLASIFQTLYEQGGSNARKYFRIYKAIAIAQAIVDTYKSAVSAFSAMSGIPYVGPALGAVAAAAAIASGMARVAAIRNMQPQGAAEGGLIGGASPHTKADDKLIWATSGEYMQPVSAVRHYGLRAMDAIKKKLVPRELLMSYAGIPDPITTMRRGYQAGGAITGATAVRRDINQAQREAGGERDVNITNVVDPNLMGQYLSSRPGEQQVLNIISENNQLVKTALFSRDG